MPYASDSQRRFMHARHPEIAKRWDREYGSKPLDQLAGKRATPKKRRRGVRR